jgi:small subunit ribosomal protein S7
MPPRLNLFRAHRSLAIRTRSSIGPGQPRITVAVAHRCFADQKKPPVTGPNEHGLGHVSEEAADVGKVMGKTQPDLGRSTPVQEVCPMAEELWIISMTSDTTCIREHH